MLDSVPNARDEAEEGAEREALVVMGRIRWKRVVESVSPLDVND